MHPIPWFLALLISLPQTMLLVLLGFGLFNFKVSLKKCLMVSFGIAAICFFIRKLSISFINNTLTLTIILTLLTAFIFKINLRYSFISVLLGVMIIGGTESLLLPIFFKLTGYTINDLSYSARVNILAFVPIFLTDLSFYLLSRHFKIILFDFGGKGEQII